MASQVPSRPINRAKPPPEGREASGGHPGRAELRPARSEAVGDVLAVAIEVENPFAVGQGQGGQHRVGDHPPAQQRPIIDAELAPGRRHDPAELVQGAVAVPRGGQGARGRRAEPDPGVEQAHAVRRTRKRPGHRQVQVERQAGVPSQAAEERELRDEGQPGPTRGRAVVHRLGVVLGQDLHVQHDELHAQQRVAHDSPQHDGRWEARQPARARVQQQDQAAAHEAAAGRGDVELGPGNGPVCGLGGHRRELEPALERAGHGAAAPPAGAVGEGAFRLLAFSI
eukprot:scaffold4651_cov122-Isochrysis_galbana.AAC.2